MVLNDIGLFEARKMRRSRHRDEPGVRDRVDELIRRSSNIDAVHFTEHEQSWHLQFAEAL